MIRIENPPINEKSPLSGKFHFKRIADSEENKRVVYQALKEKVNILFASDILKDIENPNISRSRILFCDDAPIGAILFNSSITEENEDLNIKKGLGIREIIVIGKGESDKELVYKKLIEKAVQKAQESKAECLYLLTDDSNQETISLFKHTGFTEVFLKGTNYTEQLVIKNFMQDQPKTEEINKTEIENNSNAKGVFENRPKRKTSDQSKMENNDNRVKRLKQEPSKIANEFAPKQQQRSSKMHTCTLKKIYLDQILSGKKTVEGRINSGMFLRIKEGDSIKFFCGSNNYYTKVICKVTKIEKFASFEAMLNQVGYQNCLPECYSLYQAANEYSKIPHYTDKARQNGVLALHIEKVG